MKNKKNSRFLVPGFCAVLSCSLCLVCLIMVYGCNNYYKNDYQDNSPTSGMLKLYYDEGLELHVKNHAFTFEGHYPNAHIKMVSSTDNEAVQALYNDSCEMIMISRPLNEKENKAFASKSFTINPTAAAKSGIALITNINSPLNKLSFEEVVELLSKEFTINDSLNNAVKINVLFDKNNSSVLYYLKDSVLRNKSFSPNISVSNSSPESINYIAKNKNAVAFIDFAWLSDVDDSVSKANNGKIKFIAVSKTGSNVYEFPNQSSFKLNSYPFTRTVYIIKKTGEFTLAKGFETFVASAQGQNTFLKQGLLPIKQQERSIEVKLK